MKKSVYKIFAVIIAALTFMSVPLLSASAAEDGMYLYEVKNGEATITEYLGSGTSTVTLPTSLGGYPVTGVGDYAFGKTTNGVKPHAEITQVIIHSGIKEIGDRAFAGTTWFGSKSSADSDGFLIRNGMLLNYFGETGDVKVPSSVKKINIAAFEKNSGVKTVTLPAETVEIDAYAFYKCMNLRTVTIKGDITSIGKSAFYGCVVLAEINGKQRSAFPDSLKSIGDNAFYGCSSLSGKICTGSGLETLGVYAFANCPSLTEIEVPDTLKNIGSYAMGFALESKDGAYYPKKYDNFKISVTHIEKEDPSEEQQLLKSYSKTSTAVYKYATNPDGNGYFGSIPLSWARLPYPFKLGDVNNDGKANSSDARTVLRHAAKLSLIENESDKKAADTNGDGRINSTDARRILRATALLETL